MATQSNFGTTLDLNEVIDDMFMVLTDKEKEVIIRRFSLNSGPKETLEKIGKSFSVTRERVRQIENAALNKLRRTVDNTKLKAIIRMAKEILAEEGSVMLEKTLISKILLTINHVETPVDGNAIRLALNIDEDILRIKYTNNYFPAWRLDDVKEKDIHIISNLAQKILNKKKEIMNEADLVKEVQNDLTKHYSGKFIAACFTIDKQLKAVEGHRWGLITWRHINPKSIRDKAYIILKSTDKPMHFVDIANSIINFGFDKKTVTTQAVNNELIRGEQFVLVGRGLYALREWGYMEGTVSDVIERILRENAKPMQKSDIVQEVLKVRKVKVGTIALNLQKNPKFVRVGRAVYSLKK
jgi:DNA-directed RNA polymerase delta subunit